MNFDKDRQRFFEMMPGLKTFQLFSDKKDKGGIPKIFHYAGNDLPFPWLDKLEDLPSGILPAIII